VIRKWLIWGIFCPRDLSHGPLSRSRHFEFERSCGLFLESPENFFVPEKLVVKLQSARFEKLNF